jgi:iron complex outermembrane receptor protein
VETAAVGATTVQRVTNFNFVAPVPVKVNGLELELGYQIRRNWSFDSNVAYAKSKIKNGSVPCNDYFPHDGAPDTVSTIPTVAQIQAATNGGTISACQVDFRAQITPPWSGNLTSEYYRPVTDTMDGYLRGLLTVYGKNQNDPSNPVDNVSAYALLNLYAGVRDPKGGWDMAFYAKNITNTERVLARGPTALTTPFNVLAASNTGVTTYRGGGATFGLTMTQPREVGITARYAFGSR